MQNPQFQTPPAVPQQQMAQNAQQSPVMQQSMMLAQNAPQQQSPVMQQSMMQSPQLPGSRPGDNLGLKLRVAKKNTGATDSTLPELLFLIDDMIPGSSSQRSGLLQKGDVIMRVDGQAVDHDVSEQLQNRLRGMVCYLEVAREVGGVVTSINAPLQRGTVPTSAIAQGPPGTVPTSAIAQGPPGTVPTSAIAQGPPGSDPQMVEALNRCQAENQDLHRQLAAKTAECDTQMQEILALKAQLISHNVAPVVVPAAVATSVQSTTAHPFSPAGFVPWNA